MHKFGISSQAKWKQMNIKNYTDIQCLMTQ